MAQLDVMEPSALDSGYLAPSCAAKGSVASALFHPGDYSLWQVSAELGAGRRSWDGPTATRPSTSSTGRSKRTAACGAGRVIVVEADASGTVRAVTDTKLLHVGSTVPPAATGAAAGMHVVDAAGGRHVRFEGHPIENIYFADSTCPTCQIVLFTVSCDEAHTAASHLHSEDEIIHVLDGELQVGPQTVKAGMSVAIPAGRRYGFRTPGRLQVHQLPPGRVDLHGAPGTDPVVEIPVG